MTKTPHRLLALATTALIAIVALSGFLTVSHNVQSGKLADFDRAVLLTMRTPGDLSDPIGPSWVEEIMRDCTALGGMTVSVLLTGSAIVMLVLLDRKVLAIYVGGAILSGLLVCLGLKSSYDRPRPQIAPHGSHVYTKSFPSGHTMTAATVYLTLGTLLARAQKRRFATWYVLTIAVSVTLLVGLSRVYLAVHWPSDVIAGWLLGAGWALLSWCVAALLTERFRRGPSVVAQRISAELADPLNEPDPIESP